MPTKWRLWTIIDEKIAMRRPETLTPSCSSRRDPARGLYETLGLSINKLALDLHVPATRIGEIVHEHRRITADTALRLARYFNTNPEFWLNLQNFFDLEVERRPGAAWKSSARCIPVVRRLPEGCRKSGRDVGAPLVGARFVAARFGFCLWAAARAAPTVPGHPQGVPLPVRRELLLAQFVLALFDLVEPVPSNVAEDLMEAARPPNVDLVGPPALA